MRNKLVLDKEKPICMCCMWHVTEFKMIKEVNFVWRVPGKNYETLVDSFMPHEIARPVDRDDRIITVEEYEEIQDFYRTCCKAKKKYTK